MQHVQIQVKSGMIQEKVGLGAHPVGAKLLFRGDRVDFDKVDRLVGYRYCQAVMEARHGRHVMLDKEGISCPAAAAAFGFKPLPKGLENGKGLVGFGITKVQETGIKMFEGMTTMQLGEIEAIYLFPLATARIEPDVVIVEDQIEKLMWLALAWINAKGGRRVESSTAVLQAVCVDSTLVPFVEKKMNLSYGCYGCRDATDMAPGECVLGFPFSDFVGVAEHIEYLSEKAIPASRSKKAYANIDRGKP